MLGVLGINQELISGFAYLTESICLCLLLRSILNGRYFLNNNIIGAVFPVTLMFVAHYVKPIAFHLVGLEMIVNISIDILIVIIFYKGVFSKKLLACSVFYLLMALSEILALALFLAVGRWTISPVETIEIIPFALVAVSHAILSVTVILFSALCKRYRGSIKKHRFPIFATITVCSYLALVSPYGDKDNIYFRNPFVPFFVSAFALVLALFIMMALNHAISVNFMQREKLSELEKRFNLQNKYHLEKTKRYRKQFETLHDIGNHLAVLEMKLTSQEDRAYIKSLREKLGSAVRETGYGNIDCIVLIKYIEMAKKGIELDVKGVLPESIPWLEAVDIMNIMGNSIDNAINAVSRIRRSERKPIKLSFSCSDDYLAIQMINQTAQRNIQPKRKGDSEGLGLKSIAASAEKYGGGMSAEDKDGLFTLSVILYSKNK